MYWFFFFYDTATTEIYTYCPTLSLHDALPISTAELKVPPLRDVPASPSSIRHLESIVLTANKLGAKLRLPRSEEHTSELQSLMRISYAVFCLKKKIKHKHKYTLRNTHYNRISKFQHYITANIRPSTIAR